MYTWATDIKSALLLNNNVTDDTGNYSWTNSGSVPFSSIIFYEGTHSAGPFSSTKNINANITDTIQTVDFWAYVPSGSVVGTLFSFNSDLKLYYNAELVYFYDSTYGQIGGFAVPLDTWFRVQVAWDGTYETVYINGVEQAEQQNPNPPTGTLRLGNNAAGDDPFGGYIDLVKISTIDYQGVEPLPVPVLTLISVSPNQGPETGGTAVTLTGLYFSTVTQVLFDGIAALNVVIVDDHTITCVTPVDTPGNFIPVEVDSATESSVVTHGYKYNAVVIIPPDVGGAQMIFEKRNYVIDTDGNGTPATITPASPLIQDNKHTHFNVDTGAVNYTKLSAGSNIVIDFGAAIPIKKVTAFLYPKQPTYYALESDFNNAAIKIEFWDGAAWQALNWASFNEFYGLPSAQLANMGTYAAYTSTAGIVSIWDATGITTTKLRFTAPGVDIGITEIEACDLVITEPANMRVNEISSTLGEYQGIRVDGTFIDTDYNICKSVNYRANAFLYATYNGVSKYFGLLFVDSNLVDEQNYQTYIECVNIYDKLASANVNINADIGVQDYAQVFEWLLACADIYRDLYLMSVNVKNYNYIPENTDVQTEINNVIQSGGDMQMFTQDGIFAIKSRISETPTTEIIDAYTTGWFPQYNLFIDDYLNFVLPSWVDMFAPINGFSLAETFDNTLAAWGNGYLINRVNASFLSAPDLETNVGSTGTQNHYRLKLQTPVLNNIGLWRVRGQMINYSRQMFWVGQYIAAKGQGTVNITTRIIDAAHANTVLFSETFSVNTSAARIRVVYYYWGQNGEIGRIVFNQDTNTIISRNDQIYTSTVSYSINTLDFQIESANTAGASAIIEAVGVCGVSQRSVVFTGSTPDAISFLNLIVPSAASFTIFTLTSGDTDPVLSVAGSANSASGDTMSVILIPLLSALQNIAPSFTIPYPIGTTFFTNFAANWTRISLTSDISVVYLPTTGVDIENGNLPVYPRDLKYLKGARNVDEDVVFNRLQIAINNFTNNGAANVYENENAFVITNTASKFTYTLTGQTLDLGTGLNFYINVVINSVAYEYNYAPGTYYNTVMDCDIVFSTVTSGNTITAFTISITPRGQTLSRNIQRLIVSQAANVYNNELPFIVHSTPYTVTIPTDPLNLLKPVIMAVNVTISGVNYTFYFTPSLLPQYNATMDCNITFAAYSLGVILTIAPVSLFDRNIKFVKITAFSWNNSSSTTDIVNYADSQAVYGILEQDISNTKINSETQSVLIQQKYSRFLSLPVLFLADGATCDLIVNIDFAKYVIIQDQLIYLENILFKIYEYEFTIDVTANDYQMTVKGRAQSYSDY
jgi:hypothetical protein